MSSHPLDDLGRRVRAARRAAGLRQSDLAARAGVSRYTLVKLEGGRLTDVNFKTLVSILEPLGLELRLGERRATGLAVLGEPE
jgi:transcriptional regulator with XRE-family HTH domain